ncbi:MAG: hypothetical protein MZV65_33145 [Chromatiales bacterium]|nr:hypothetical protein [Chromatiales bacterium]
MRAVDGVSLRADAGKFLVLLGPVGLRQVDDAAADRRARGADRRPDPASAAATSRRSPPDKRDVVDGVPVLRAVSAPDGAPRTSSSA